MIFVRAAKHEDIFIKLFGSFYLKLFDSILFEANHTFLVFHFGFSELELKGWKIGYLKHIMVLFLLVIIFMIEVLHNEGDDLKKITTAVYRILIVEIHLHFLFTNFFVVKIILLFPLHLYKYQLFI